MRHLKLLILLCVTTFSQNLNAQNSSFWLNEAASELSAQQKTGRNSKDINNIKRISRASKNGNAFTFMYLGPLLDGLNNLYESTKDEKYLQQGYEVVKNVISSAKTSRSDKQFKTWYVSSNQQRYKEANNNEWMLFEGHLFRYVVQYLYLVDQNSRNIKNTRIRDDNKAFVDFVYKNVWKKWHSASLRTRGDLTLLYGVRVHNGAHWATIAKYLDVLLSNPKAKKEFEEFYSSYDSWLKKNIRTETNCYVWNGTWDNVFLKAHRDRIAKGLDLARIQDTAHGNHVVQYIVASYKIGNGWTMNDLNYLANTLLNRIVDPETTLSSEYIDGSGKKKYLDLSDGWLKLAWFNTQVKELYSDFYKKNKSRVSSSHQNLQFYSLGASF